jgi:hypothetical protein
LKLNEKNAIHGDNGTKIGSVLRTQDGAAVQYDNVQEDNITRLLYDKTGNLVAAETRDGENYAYKDAQGAPMTKDNFENIYNQVSKTTQSKSGSSQNSQNTGGTAQVAYVIQPGESLSKLIDRILDADGKSGLTGEERTKAKKEVETKFRKDNPKAFTIDGKYLLASATVKLDKEIDCPTAPCTTAQKDAKKVEADYIHTVLTAYNYKQITDNKMLGTGWMALLGVKDDATLQAIKSKKPEEIRALIEGKQS